MRSISIYTITRNQNLSSLSKLERQLSDREHFLKIREWELESMKSLVRRLEDLFSAFLLFLSDSQTRKRIRSSSDQGGSDYKYRIKKWSCF